MRQRVIVDGDASFLSQKQRPSNSRVLCGWWKLVTIVLDDVVIVSRCNDNLCTGVQRIELVPVQVVENLLQSFCGT